VVENGRVFMRAALSRLALRAGCAGHQDSGSV